MENRDGETNNRDKEKDRDMRRERKIESEVLATQLQKVV